MLHQPRLPRRAQASRLPGVDFGVKIRLLGGEVLRAMVHAEVIAAPGGHAPTHALAFVEHGHLAAGGGQLAGAADAGQAGANHGDVGVLHGGARLGK